MLLIEEKVTTLRVGDVIGLNGRSPTNYVAATDDVQVSVSPEPGSEWKQTSASKGQALRTQRELNES